MSGSIYGTLFKLSTWGESHGKGVGVVVDGCPAGLPLCEEDIQRYLDRRKPGQSPYATSRMEADQVEILSGVFEGKTTGTPISMAVYNRNQRSKDYSELAGCYRPGHADLTFDAKYGFRDYTGGGRSSGRETIGRVAAGAVAMKILNALGIHVCAYTKSIGNVSIDMKRFQWEVRKENAFYMPDRSAAIEAETLMHTCISGQDSVGGVVECLVREFPAGVGEPVFDKLDASLSRAIMSIGAVKAVEVGDGTAVSAAFGSDNNDILFYDSNHCLQKESNHSGGISGGISEGFPILLRAHIKPTPSIGQVQRTVSKDGENIELQITGRHDPVIVPRAVVVVEAMVAVTLVDMLFVNMSSRMENIVKFYH